MSDKTNLQEDFLDKLQQGRRSVSVITINGYHIEGLITGHDQFTVMLETDGKRQMVYKHAISTVREGE